MWNPRSDVLRPRAITRALFGPDLQSQRNQFTPLSLLNFFPEASTPGVKSSVTIDRLSNYCYQSIFYIFQQESA